MSDQPEFFIPSMREQCSEDEWRTRVDLAACYRLIAHYGMSDMAANHISARVPGDHASFLINAYGMMYEEITASSLIKIDSAGTILSKPEFVGADYGVNRAGFVIHGAIHDAKPDISCVIHTHSWAGMALSTLKCGLLPMTQTAMRFVHIGYHEYNGVVLDMAERDRLVNDLGDNNALIFRNHGLLTVGLTIPEAFNAMHRLELSCKSQLAAMACGAELTSVPAKVLDDTFMNYQPQTRRPYGLMEWPALLRMLDRNDRSYRD